MEGLFDNPKKKYQKLLAVIDNHSSPVNCVRWNSIGTLFASAADDGSINLWEYVGEMTINSAFQKFSYTMEQQPKQRLIAGQEESKEAIREAQEAQPIEDQSYEEWRMKKTWNGHIGGVSDLAWSPDNIHFASCSTDSKVIIWSINEPGPVKVLDVKANGIAFDPFGKFMATQSSEERSLTIWRLQ